MEDWYKKWLQSNKLKELKRMKEENRVRNELRMTKEQLLEVIDSLMSYHNQTIKDKEVSDWLLFDKSKLDIINGHHSECIKWSYHLKTYEVIEDYEMCAYIRDIIIAETEDVKRFCRSYFAYSDDDERMINQNAIEARDFIEEEYNKHITNNGTK